MSRALLSGGGGPWLEHADDGLYYLYLASGVKPCAVFVEPEGLVRLATLLLDMGENAVRYFATPERPDSCTQDEDDKPR